jgi:hypothetical protein
MNGDAQGTRARTCADILGAFESQLPKRMTPWSQQH